MDVNALTDLEYRIWKILEVAAEPMSSKRVIELAWVGRAPPSSTAALSVMISKIRYKLPGWGVTWVRDVGWVTPQLRARLRKTREERAFGDTWARLLPREAIVWDTLCAHQGEWVARDVIWRALQKTGRDPMTGVQFEVVEKITIDALILALRQKFPGAIEKHEGWGGGWRTRPSENLEPRPEGGYQWGNRWLVPRPMERAVLEELVRAFPRGATVAVLSEAIGESSQGRLTEGHYLRRTIFRLRRLIPGDLIVCGDYGTPSHGWRLKRLPNGVG